MINTYITIAITSILAWLGIKTWLSKKQNIANKTKLDADVNNAVKHIAVEQVHIDTVEEQKIEVEKTIEVVEKEIEELNKEIFNPQITDAVTVEEAKENIIKKTSRKRKYKKKEVK
jgi:hypothetical protein